MELALAVSDHGSANPVHLRALPYMIWITTLLRVTAMRTSPFAVLLAFLSGVWLAPPAASSPTTQIWLSPDNETSDYLDLFRHPEEWTTARSHVSVFKFGPAQLCCTGPTRINSISDLTKVKAFQLLKSWGISIAIEAPSVKEWDCTGIKAAQGTLNLVRTVQHAGGVVRLISMDEPLISGTLSCRDSLEGTAAKTADYVKKLRASVPELEVGDIEAYPSETPSRLEEWIDALTAAGAKPAHFHIDVNVHYLDVHPEINAKGDLQNLMAFLGSHGIPMGIIFWSGYGPEPTDKSFFDHTMAWVRRVHSTIGVPEQSIFQSWVLRSFPGCPYADNRCGPPALKCPPSGALGCGLKAVPINLPDNSTSIYR